MTNVAQKTKAIVLNRATSFMLIAFIFAAALLYVYYANVAVRALATLEKTKSQMQTLSVEVSEMESKRLAIENNMGTEMAVKLGFVEMNHPTFIVKNSKKTALSLKID